LVDREKPLKQLNSPKLGDSLLRPDGTPWMADLQHASPKLNWDDLAQRPANPLGFWLKTDPWDDKVHQLNAKIYAYMNPRDKMPFEVTPIFYKLQRYDATAAAAAVAPASAPPAAAPPPAAADPNAQPAAPPATPPADPNAQPPAGAAPAPDNAAPQATPPATAPPGGGQPAAGDPAPPAPQPAAPAPQ
jgi:hypothetical protein